MSVQIDSIVWNTTAVVAEPNPVISDTNGTITTSGAQDYYLGSQLMEQIKALSQVHGICKLVNGGEESLGALMFFAVPNLGSVSDPFTGAEFGVNLNNNGTTDYGADLVFLGVDSDTDFNDPEHFDRSGGTLIMDEFLSSNIAQLGGGGGEPQIYTNSSANTTLTSALNSAYDNGNAVGGYFVFRVMADSSPASGNWQILSGDAGGGATEAPRLNWSTDGSALPFASSDEASDLDTLRSGGTLDVPVTGILNGDFENGITDWTTADGWGSGLVTSHVSEGGNPGGYITMDTTGGVWGVGLFVSNNNSHYNIAALGIEAGNTYTFSIDAKSDTNLMDAGIKLEYVGGP